MLQFALEYRKPIDIITADKLLKLRKYELDDEDWNIIKDLVAVLEANFHVFCMLKRYLQSAQQIYKKATVFFSSNSASIAAVIPAMDKLENTLNPQTKKPYHSSIHAAMKLAQKKLNRYYGMTDLSSAYRIAMGTSSSL